MHSVFYAVLMMSMEGGFIAVCVLVCFSLLFFRLFDSGDQILLLHGPSIVSFDMFLPWLAGHQKTERISA